VVVDSGLLVPLLRIINPLAMKNTVVETLLYRWGTFKYFPHKCSTAQKFLKYEEMWNLKAKH
jgi:hypothetical protein